MLGSAQWGLSWWPMAALACFIVAVSFLVSPWCSGNGNINGNSDNNGNGNKNVTVNGNGNGNGNGNRNGNEFIGLLHTGSFFFLASLSCSGC